MPVFILFTSLLLLFSGSLFSKVRILTFHYNQADFIEIQHRCLQKFMSDDYELIVFNDARTADNERAIQQTCEKFGIQCIRFEQEWHFANPANMQSPSDRHARVIQYALDYFGYDNNDPVAIMDGDAFFIRKISIKDRLKDLDIFGMARSLADTRIPVNYLWVPFVAFDPKKLPNLKDLKFHPTIINNTWQDTGAASHYYLKNNPSVKYKRTEAEITALFSPFSNSELRNWGFSPAEISLIRNLGSHGCQVELNIDRCILHFREVSFEASKHHEKLECLYKFINQILTDYPDRDSNRRISRRG